MHKKDDPNAGPGQLNATEQIHYTSSDFIVCSAIGHLSGKRNTTVLRGIGIGSNCGSLRAFLSGSFASCLATVNTRSKA